jgi:hypothetical protein
MHLSISFFFLTFFPVNTTFFIFDSLSTNSVDTLFFSLFCSGGGGVRVLRNTNDDHLGFAIDHTKQAKRTKKDRVTSLYIFIFKF